MILFFSTIMQLNSNPMAAGLYLLGRFDDACVERTRQLLEKRRISYDYMPSEDFCLLTPGMRYASMDTIESLFGEK